MTATPLITSLFGISTALVWGFADYLGARASKRFNPNVATLAVSSLGTLLFTLVFLFNHGSQPWNSNGVLYAIASGISLELGLLAFYRGLNAGPVNLVSPISSAYPLVSTALVLLAFGGSLRPLEIAGIFIIVSGITIATGLFSTKKSERRVSSGVVYALLTVVIWGIAYSFIGKAVESLGWQKATLINFYSGLAILPIALTILEGRGVWDSVNKSLFKDTYVIAAAAAQTVGGIIFSIGLTHARSSAVLTAISATYPALTIFLAIRGLKEKAVAVSLIGSFITIAGIILLSL